MDDLEIIRRGKVNGRAFLVASNLVDFAKECSLAVDSLESH
ncbi:4125_t:CDS:1, partial [Funneliformis mosseae]